MRRKKYAVIGCGGRISNLIERLSPANDLELKGAWDPQKENARKLLELRNEGKGRIYGSFETVTADSELDWILIGSPNVFHREHICSSFNNGKNVFAEKPLATSIEDCCEIDRYHKLSGKLFATGFTLRYASLYREAARILHSGELGRIISINASENIPPEHGAYIMRNWRRKRELAGSHILEKCVHDLDILNWFTKSVPVRVAAFGGNNMFIPENSSLYENHSQIFDNWPWRNDLARTFDQGHRNPFLSDKSIEDNIIVIMDFANGVKVQFQATTSNTIPERRMYVHCNKGTMILELYSGTMKYKALGEEELHLLSFKGGGHGDGDDQIMKELHESMVSGTTPVCSGEEGLRSAIAGIGIDDSRKNGKIVDLRPVWNQIGISIPPA